MNKIPLTGHHDRFFPVGWRIPGTGVDGNFLPDHIVHCIKSDVRRNNIDALGLSVAECLQILPDADNGIAFETVAVCAAPVVRACGVLITARRRRKNKWNVGFFCRGDLKKRNQRVNVKKQKNLIRRFSNRNNRNFWQKDIDRGPLMNMRGGSMLLLHNKVSGGVQYSQIMISSFFDRFYVMPPLTNGVHYNFHYSVLLFLFLKSTSRQKYHTLTRHRFSRCSPKTTLSILLADWVILLPLL